jgi:hypothetical protein
LLPPFHFFLCLPFKAEVRANTFLRNASWFSIDYLMLHRRRKSSTVSYLVKQWPFSQEGLCSTDLIITSSHSSQ